jgi:hypothetical protein
MPILQQEKSTNIPEQTNSIAKAKSLSDGPCVSISAQSAQSVSSQPPSLIKTMLVVVRVRAWRCIVAKIVVTREAAGLSGFLLIKNPLTIIMKKKRGAKKLDLLSSEKTLFCALGAAFGFGDLPRAGPTLRKSESGVVLVCSASRCPAELIVIIDHKRAAVAAIFNFSIILF